MEDRIVQQAIKQVIEPICEAAFSNDSFGFRPNRSTEHAIAALSRHINRGKLHHIVDLDIEGFFDNVVHHTLLRQLWRLGIQDGEVIALISRILKAEIEMPDRTRVRPEKGTPQGGVISPLLANVALNDLDHWINSKWRNRPTARGYGCQRKDGGVHWGNKYKALRKTTKLKAWHIVRYADDVKIICETKTAGRRAYEATTNYLGRRLGLRVNPEKSGVVNVKKNPTEFLGISIKAEPKRGKWVVQSHMLKSASPKDPTHNRCKTQTSSSENSNNDHRIPQLLPEGDTNIQGYEMDIIPSRTRH